MSAICRSQKQNRPGDNFQNREERERAVCANGKEKSVSRQGRPENGLTRAPRERGRKPAAGGRARGRTASKARADERTNERSRGVYTAYNPQRQWLAPV